MISAAFHKRRPASEICLRPFCSTIAAGSAPLSNIRANTSLAIRPEMVPSWIRSTSRPSCSGVIGEDASSRPARGGEGAVLVRPLFGALRRGLPLAGVEGAGLLLGRAARLDQLDLAARL